MHMCMRVYVFMFAWTTRALPSGARQLYACMRLYLLKPRMHFLQGRHKRQPVCVYVGLCVCFHACWFAAVMSMYRICIYVCMYVCMYVCIYKYIDTCIYLMHTRMLVCSTAGRTHVYTMYISTYTCIYTCCISESIYVYLSIYLSYSYTYLYTTL